MQAMAVPSRIDVTNAAQVLESLRGALAGAGPVRPEVDLASLKDFDSSALSLLLQLVRDRAASEGHGHAPTAGGQAMLLLNPPPKLRALAELYGVEEMLFGTVNGSAAPAAA
jgi:ABC-type transporter Mla MlaB component